MKKIIWTGESRVVPGYGYAVIGRHLLLPEEQAASFVAQGLAEPESPPKKTSTKSTQED